MITTDHKYQKFKKKVAIELWNHPEMLVSSKNCGKFYFIVCLYTHTHTHFAFLKTI